MLDFIRIACAVNPVRVGDVTKNVMDICNQIAQADEQGADLVAFPEMALTGYTCADLFFEDTLLEACRRGLADIAACTASHPGITAVVGLPVVIRGQMYNCGAVLRDGRVQGVVPKTYLPNYNEFYERRWFSSSEDLTQSTVDA